MKEVCKTHPLNAIRTGHVPCGHGFFSAAKGVYAIHIPLAYAVHLHVGHFCPTSYFQTRRAEIPSLKGFLFYLMRHFPPPEDALLPFDRHRPQRNSRFPRLFERKRSFRLFFTTGWIQCCAIAWCFSCKAVEGQPLPFLLCVNRFIELLYFDKK